MGGHRTFSLVTQECGLSECRVELFVKRSLFVLLLIWSLLATTAVNPTGLAAQRRTVPPRPATSSAGSAAAPQQSSAAPPRLPQAQLINRIPANAPEVIGLES